MNNINHHYKCRWFN